jgi:hypothetical protein
MVKEMRKIILSRDECIAALESYKRTNFEFLPVGKILKCELKAGSPVIVGIEIAGAITMKLTECTLEPPKLLEPLIRFCIEHNIVLPRNSRKSALTGDDQAVLYIQMSTTENM